MIKIRETAKDLDKLALAVGAAGVVGRFGSI
jgi:hypothetical protein